MVNDTQKYLCEHIQQSVNNHPLLSGEIIFKYSTIDKAGSISTIIADFFLLHNIRTSPQKYWITETDKTSAIQSIRYGLSIKANYTKTDHPFSESEGNQLIYSFLQLFHNPSFFTTDAKVYQTPLNLEDFWECGGTIALDKTGIGILWINDLYNKF